MRERINEKKKCVCSARPWAASTVCAARCEPPTPPPPAAAAAAVVDAVAAYSSFLSLSFFFLLYFLLALTVRRVSAALPSCSFVYRRNITRLICDIIKLINCFFNFL